MRPIRFSSAVVTLIVAIAAFVVSAQHLVGLGHRYGEHGWLAFGTPIILDGMQIVGGMVSLRFTLEGRSRRAQAFPMLLVYLGTGASIAGNVAVSPAAAGDIVGLALYAAPPAFLALTWHAFLVMLRGRLTPVPVHGVSAVHVGPGDAPAVRRTSPTVTRRAAPAGRLTSINVNPETSVAPGLAPTTASPVSVPIASQELHLIPKPGTSHARENADPTNLAALAYAACDRLTARGQAPTPDDFRAVIAEEKLLLNYSRPDRAVRARVASWAKARTTAA